MPKRITVTALKPLHYEGRSHVRGSVFTTTPVDAASLKYRGLAKLGGQLAGGAVTELPSISRRMEPVAGFQAGGDKEPVKPEPPMPPSEQTIEQVDQTAVESVVEPETKRTGRGRGRNSYQRRDMNAEPPSTEPGL